MTDKWLNNLQFFLHITGHQPNKTHSSTRVGAPGSLLGQTFTLNFWARARHHSLLKFYRWIQCTAKGRNTSCCCCSVASVLSDSMRPHRRQPTRLCRPWDSPGKSTGVGCHRHISYCIAIDRVMPDSWKTVKPFGLKLHLFKMHLYNLWLTFCLWAHSRHSVSLRTGSRAPTDTKILGQSSSLSQIPYMRVLHPQVQPPAYHKHSINATRWAVGWICGCETADSECWRDF